MDLVSDRQRHAFYGSGYVIFPGLFNSDEVDAIAKGFDYEIQCRLPTGGSRRAAVR